MRWNPTSAQYKIAVYYRAYTPQLNKKKRRSLWKKKRRIISGDQKNQKFRTKLLPIYSYYLYMCLQSFWRPTHYIPLDNIRHRLLSLLIHHMKDQIFTVKILTLQPVLQELIKKADKIQNYTTILITLFVMKALQFILHRFLHCLYTGKGISLSSYQICYHSYYACSS